MRYSKGERVEGVLVGAIGGAVKTIFARCELTAEAATVSGCRGHHRERLEYVVF